MAAFLLPMKLSSTRKMTRHAEPVLGVDLGDDLRGGLDPRLAAEDDDDVAELALERAAARGLDAAHRVLAKRDEVVARQRDLGHVGLLGLLVPRRVLAARPFLEEPRPGLLGLADEDDVDEAVEPVLGHADPGAADDRRRCRGRAAPRGSRASGRAGPSCRSGRRCRTTPRASKSISSMFSSISDDLMLRRRQPGQHRQRQDRHVRLLAQQGQAVVESPERGREARVDQADPCHVAIPALTWRGSARSVVDPCLPKTSRTLPRTSPTLPLRPRGSGTVDRPEIARTARAASRSTITQPGGFS